MGRVRYPYRMGERFPEKRAEAYPPDPTCVLDVPMFEGAGGIAEDRSVHKNNGAIANATWEPGGSNGGYLEFNGTSAVVVCADDASLDLSGVLTLEAWVYGVGQSVTHAGIIDKGADVDGYLLRVSTNQVKFFLRKTGDVPEYALISVNSLLPVNTWTHCVAVRDGSNNMGTYVNGVKQVATANFVSVLSPSGVDLAIGKYGLVYFEGSLFGVRVYSRALSAQEILDIYERTKP